MTTRAANSPRVGDTAGFVRDTGQMMDLPTLSDAFDHAAVSLSLSDPHGRIVSANQAFYDLFGYDEDAAIDVGMLSRAVDEDWTVSYLSRLATGDLDEFRSLKRFVHADGSEFEADVAIRAIRRNGVCVGMIARVEPAAARPVVDNDRLRKLMQHSPGTLSLVSPDGDVIETSGRYRATLGYPVEFWENRTIIDIVVPEDLSRMAEMRDEVVASPGHSITADFHVQSADRSIETLEVTALNMISDPDLGGIVLSTHKVTADRNNTRALGAMRDEAVAEAERRSRLLATVSHELRNPLHAMSGLAELLASDDGLAKSQRELAQSLLRQLRHLTSVTEDLLDTARFEVGRFEIRPSPVVVRDLVEDVTRTATSFADGRIEVNSVVEEGVPRLTVLDPARLQQVLGNLIGNAVKFTEAGSVTLSLGLDEHEDIEGPALVFEVSDTGIGIPLDQIARVFAPFSTATTSGDRRGAGLGLAIVQRLVEALGGSISVRSTVGEGTTFTVALPHEPADEVALNDEVDAAVAAARPRILVVEDTPVNQELARHQLDRLEMDCFIAESAEVGLVMLDAESYDVVLMDHQLPGMNGRDATREIRRRGLTVPIIGVTASSTAADEQACLEAGMNAFLPKPVGLERLASALVSVLEEVDQPEPAEAPPIVEAGVAVDTTVLDDLAEELGDRSIVAGLVTTFLEELDARQSDIAVGEAVLAARQAHTLKSSAKLLGAQALSEVCAAAEDDASARPLIIEAANAAKAELRAWLGDDPSSTAP